MESKHKNISETAILWINLRQYFLIWLPYYMLRKIGLNNIPEIGEQISTFWAVGGGITIFISSFYLNKYRYNDIKEVIKYHFLLAWLILTVIFFEIIVFF